MTTRPKPPPTKTPLPPTPSGTRNAPNAIPTQDQRWQRTVRFSWDNGGKRGGSKDGRK